MKKGQKKQQILFNLELLNTLKKNLELEFFLKNCKQIFIEHQLPLVLS